MKRHWRGSLSSCDRPEVLSAAEQAVVADAIFKGPTPPEDGVTCEVLTICISARFGKTVQSP
jgi:hypothetical protein